MIKPGDIPEKLIELAEDYIRVDVGHFQAATSEEKAAAILNAAIEAGLVSPAVWAYRDEYGNFHRLHDGSIVLTPEKRDWKAIEHWKGQTE